MNDICDFCGIEFSMEASRGYSYKRYIEMFLSGLVPMEIEIAPGVYKTYCSNNCWSLENEETE